MKALTILVVAFVLLGLGTAWAQTTAPPPPAPPQSAPGAAPTPGSRPAAPPATGSDTTTPRAQAPGAPTASDDRAVGDRGGLGPWGWGILGLVVLGIIVALAAGRRRRDVVVDEPRLDTRLEDPTLRTYESEAERERRRRAS